MYNHLTEEEISQEIIRLTKLIEEIAWQQTHKSKQAFTKAEWLAELESKIYLLEIQQIRNTRNTAPYRIKDESSQAPY